jgi:predicted nucleotidyltransferase
MLTIEDKLQQYAKQFYISKNGPESPKIEASLKSIKNKLRQEFGDRIVGIEIFGSYERKTLLPREYDSLSDIYLLIVFDHENIDVRPSTYRKYLHQFAEKYYPNSISYKSQPSVVLELNYINYDLVPAYTQEEGFFNITDEVYIPEDNYEWQHTNIDEFTQALDKKNKENDYNVKRVIRLLKAWNAKVGYPIQSYELEQLIADMDFGDDDIESVFFYAIDNLPDDWDTDKAEEKVASLKENADLLYEALDEEEEYDVTRYLKKILPI